MRALRLGALALAPLLLVPMQPAAARQDQFLMRGGRVYEPARIEQALGIAARAGS